MTGVKLRGGLPHTSSSAEIRADGSLVIEWYDFSPEAQSSMGGDVAFFVIVAPANKLTVLERLTGEPAPALCAEHLDQKILALIQERFEDYVSVKRWLEACGIPYEKDFDGRA